MPTSPHKAQDISFWTVCLSACFTWLFSSSCSFRRVEDRMSDQNQAWWLGDFLHQGLLGFYLHTLLFVAFNLSSLCLSFPLIPVNGTIAQKCSLSDQGGWGVSGEFVIHLLWTHQWIHLSIYGEPLVPGVVWCWTDWKKMCSLLIHFSSVAQLCPTLCNPMNCSSPGFPVCHQLPEFTQTHVPWVGDAIQPC